MGNGRKSIKVLIADDLAHVRQGLRTILGLINGLEIVAEAENGLEAVRLAAQFKPDIVLMDLEMPQFDGLEATQQIKKCCPDISIVMLTIHDTAADRDRAARAGADAFVAKGTDMATLVETIKKVRGCSLLAI